MTGNATTQGRAVPSEGRCDPKWYAGAPMYHGRSRASPPLPDPRFVGLLGQRSGASFRCKELQRSDVPLKMCNPPRNELTKKVKIKYRKIFY
jgi:hypothetical protein